MSDNFIPLNQSTPVHRQWNQGRNQNHNQSGLSGFRNNHFQNNMSRRAPRQPNRNKWDNNSGNTSFSSDNNSYSNNSFSNNRNAIDAYLHPAMLEDPWAQLRQQKN